MTAAARATAAEAGGKINPLANGVAAAAEEEEEEEEKGAVSIAMTRMLVAEISRTDEQHQQQRRQQQRNRSRLVVMPISQLRLLRPLLQPPGVSAKQQRRAHHNEAAAEEAANAAPLPHQMTRRKMRTQVRWFWKCMPMCRPAHAKLKFHACALSTSICDRSLTHYFNLWHRVLSTSHTSHYFNVLCRFGG